MASTTTHEQRLGEELKDLVSIGHELISDARRATSSLGADHVSLASQWISRIGQAINSLYADKCTHQQRYFGLLNEHKYDVMHSNYHQHIASMLGVIDAIKHEYEMGLIGNLRAILRGDVFADFLDMSEHLLENGYKDAAAVMIGAVMEDSLREIAKSHGISLLNANSRPLTIEPLNQACASVGAYSKLIQKQVTSWGDLRNKAAHGQYDGYDHEQVHMMLLFVQKFCCDHNIK